MKDLIEFIKQILKWSAISIGVLSGIGLIILAFLWGNRYINQELPQSNVKVTVEWHGNKCDPTTLLEGPAAINIYNGSNRVINRTKVRLSARASGFSENIATYDSGEETSKIIYPGESYTFCSLIRGNNPFLTTPKGYIIEKTLIVEVASYSVTFAD